jgi:hypothetical protein
MLFWKCDLLRPVICYDVRILHRYSSSAPAKVTLASSPSSSKIQGSSYLLAYYSFKIYTFHDFKMFRKYIIPEQKRLLPLSSPKYYEICMEC